MSEEVQEYPKMLYASGGRTRIVKDPEQQEAAEELGFQEGPLVEEPEEEEEQEAAEEVVIPVWGGKMGPEEYLERYPEGPKADLARAVIDGNGE